MANEQILASTGVAYALAGRVVTMMPDLRVLQKARVYIKTGRIVAVVPEGQAPPAQFVGAPVVQTQGTIYPGLIELHNHLAYNALPPLDLTQRYSNRAQWRGQSFYRKNVSGPASVLGATRSPDLLAALTRYAEAKCLVSGVTTSQGITLQSLAGVEHAFRGLIRNAEASDAKDLKNATTKVDDVDANNRAAFVRTLARFDCVLLHLSEGTDLGSRAHFLALQGPDSSWAISTSLAGIHAVALQPADWTVMGQNGGALIWSPLSNFLLYGATTDVAAAKAAGVRICLGSDWSPSGSKNLLGELKVAWLHSHLNGDLFSDVELVAMVTSTPAAVLGWQSALGSISANKYADLMVLAGTTGDPYRKLIRAMETDVSLVTIAGIPRFGRPGLMARFEPPTESVTIGGLRRQLFLSSPTMDPLIQPPTLSVAIQRLTDGLRNLPQLALDIEQAAAGPAAVGSEWRLVLDEDDSDASSFRHHLPFGPDGTATAELPEDFIAAPQPLLSSILTAMSLDPLAVVDDPNYITRLVAQPNLPAAIAAGLPALF